MSSKRPQEGDIWLAYVYFEDKPTIGKVRPVLVLDCNDDYVLAVKITTHKPRSGISDYGIQNWEVAGLERPSTARCSPVFKMRVDELLRERPLGSLAQSDRENIVNIMSSLGLLKE